MKQFTQFSLVFATCCYVVVFAVLCVLIAYPLPVFFIICFLPFIAFVPLLACWWVEDSKGCAIRVVISKEEKGITNMPTFSNRYLDPFFPDSEMESYMWAIDAYLKNCQKTACQLWNDLQAVPSYVERLQLSSYAQCIAIQYRQARTSDLDLLEEYLGGYITLREYDAIRELHTVSSKIV